MWKTWQRHAVFSAQSVCSWVLGRGSSVPLVLCPGSSVPSRESWISCCVVIGIGIGIGIGIFGGVSSHPLARPAESFVLRLSSCCPASCPTANGVKINLIECEMKFVLTHTGTSTSRVQRNHPSHPLPFKPTRATSMPTRTQTPAATLLKNKWWNILPFQMKIVVRFKHLCFTLFNNGYFRHLLIYFIELCSLSTPFFAQCSIPSRSWIALDSFWPLLPLFSYRCIVALSHNTNARHCILRNCVPPSEYRNAKALHKWELIGCFPEMAKGLS